MLPLNTNIREAYACGQDQEQNFIQNLALFLCTYLKEHGALVEKKQLNEVLMKVRKLHWFSMLCIVYWWASNCCRSVLCIPYLIWDGVIEIEYML
jgi:tryptophan-rich sensory protein